MKVYEYNDHRSLIRELLQSAKKDQPGLTLSQLAEATGFTQSYLSQVLAGDYDFNSDQIFTVGRFFQLNDEELDYLCLLNEYHRCALDDRRRDLKRQLEKVQDAHLRVVEYMPYQHVETGSSPMDELLCDNQAVLMEGYFSAEKYLKNPKSVQKKLSLPDEAYERGLHLLQNARFIEKDGEAFKRVTGETMIYKINVAAKYNAVYSRLKAVEKLFGEDPSDLISTIVFRANDDFVQKAKARLLDFLNRAIDEAELDPARDEVYFVNMDLFPVEGTL